MLSGRDTLKRMDQTLRSARRDLEHLELELQTTSRALSQNRLQQARAIDGMARIGQGEPFYLTPDEDPDPVVERGDAPEADPDPSAVAPPSPGSVVGEPASAPEVMNEPDEGPGGSTIVAVAEEPPEVELPAADAPVIDLTDPSDGDAVPSPAAPLDADVETTDSEELHLESARASEASTAFLSRTTWSTIVRLITMSAL